MTADENNIPPMSSLPPELRAMPWGIRLADDEEIALLDKEAAKAGNPRQGKGALIVSIRAYIHVMQYAAIALSCALGIACLVSGFPASSATETYLYGIILIVALLAFGVFLLAKKRIPSIYKAILSLTPDEVRWCAVTRSGKRYQSFKHDEIDRITLQHGAGMYYVVALWLKSGKTVSPFMESDSPEQSGWAHKVLYYPRNLGLLLFEKKKATWIAWLLYRVLKVKLAAAFTPKYFFKTTKQRKPIFGLKRTGGSALDNGTMVTAAPHPLPYTGGRTDFRLIAGDSPEFSSISVGMVAENYAPQPTDRVFTGKMGDLLQTAILGVMLLISMSAFWLFEYTRTATLYEFVRIHAIVFVCAGFALYMAGMFMAYLYGECQLFLTDNRLTKRFRCLFLKYDKKYDKNDILAVERGFLGKGSYHAITLKTRSGKRITLFKGLPDETSRWLAESIAWWAGVPLYEPQTLPPRD